MKRETSIVKREMSNVKREMSNVKRERTNVKRERTNVKRERTYYFRSFISRFTFDVHMRQLINEQTFTAPFVFLPLILSFFFLPAVPYCFRNGM